MNNQKGVTALIVLLAALVALVGAFFILISQRMIQNPLSQVFTQKQPASSIVTKQQVTQASQYQNPFEENASGSGYSNPFSSSQNPFNNLK